MIRKVIFLMLGLAATALMLAAVLKTSAGAASTVPAAASLGTAFTYQGYLESGGTPVNRACDFRYSLFDAPAGGGQVGSTLAINNQVVTHGSFTVPLDFGFGVFDGRARWLEIGVRCPAGSGNYGTLSPRQALTPAPYAIYATWAGSAPWEDLTGVPAGFSDEIDNDSLAALSCANGEMPAWNAPAGQWNCASSQGAAYSAGTGLSLGGTVFSLDTAYTDGRYWALNGNSGTTPGSNFLGTTDNLSLTLAVNGEAALRLLPAAASPNLIGGHPFNSVASGIYGATIGGGGQAGGPNQVTSLFGTVGGGRGNTAGAASTVSGGADNQAGGVYAVVGGGQLNNASGDWAAIGGGSFNIASALDATICGGVNNSASGSDSFIGGGSDNSASGIGTTIGGGQINLADNDYATVGGGRSNIANNTAATVSGGKANQATMPYTSVGGGNGNTAAALSAVIGGGDGNMINGDYGVIGGGQNVVISGTAATVAGGSHNTIAANYAVIGGGGPSIPSDPTNTHNRVSDDYGVIGGGGNNWAGNNNASTSDASFATVGGGESNEASGAYATVGGGALNTASGHNSTISGGVNNTADAIGAVVGGGVTNKAIAVRATIGGGAWNTTDGQDATIGGGSENTASGIGATIGGGQFITVTGWYATVPGGRNNVASGTGSFAAGRDATSSHDGSFVWGDGSGAAYSTASNQFLALASNGVGFYTSFGSCTFFSGANWTCSSDRSLKENFTEVDPRDILTRLAQVPITRWNMKGQDPNVYHFGPVAQDFYTAFGLGEDDEHINTGDAQGVALAAIQGLHAIAQEQAATISELEAQNAALAARLTALEETLGEKPGSAAAENWPHWWPFGLLLIGLVWGRRHLAEGRK